MKVTRIVDLLPWQAKEYPQETCIVSKENGQWKNLSTHEVIKRVDQVARALAHFGIKPDDKIALIANNRPEWNIVDFGIQSVGAVNVPVYPTISEGEYNFIFNDAEIKIAFVSDAAIYDKVKNLKGKVPSLQEIYTFDQVPGAKHFSEFLKLDTTPDDMSRVEEYKATITPDTLATIIYTSGTTGTPKGVMLSNRNLVSNVTDTCKVLPLQAGHKCLSFLPLCHIFERIVTYTYFYIGVSLYYAESLETIGDNLKEVKPHFFTSVPRLLEKVYEKIVAKGNDLTGIKKKLFFWALDLGMQYDLRGNNSGWYNFKLGIARKLIFSKWQEALGGNLIGIVTGAAALQLRLQRVFCAAGVQVRQGYGQTESSPVITIDRYDEGEYCLGSVGQTIPNVEVKLAENGEILAKGPNVMMGYYKRPDLTAEAIKDGWLHTGDVGEFVDGKYLKITDRVKELFKTSGGKYVAPQVVENKMKESLYIEQIMVIGENEKFVSALIVPSYDNVVAWCKEKGVAHNGTADMLSKPEVLKLFRDEIDNYNIHFSHIEQVKKFKLMPKEWTIEGGEMTPTMKVKRKVVMEKYKDAVAEIYNQ